MIFYTAAIRIYWTSPIRKKDDPENTLKDQREKGHRYSCP